MAGAGLGRRLIASCGCHIGGTSDSEMFSGPHGIGGGSGDAERVHNHMVAQLWCLARLVACCARPGSKCCHSGFSNGARFYY